MQLAIFGIENDGLNLAVNVFFYMLIVVWLALGVWTYLDARRRIEDPVIVTCAAVAGFVPYIGPFVYSILRPPEFLEDARERELEIKAAELRVRQLSELSCPNCGFPVEKTYLRCPSCQRRLKDPCQSCGKPVDPRWALCPYCETALPGRQQARRAQPQARPPEAPPQQRKAATRAPSRPTRERAAAGRRAQADERPQKERAPAAPKSPKQSTGRKPARSKPPPSEPARSETADQPSAGNPE
jgi:hypothetical protein